MTYGMFKAIALAAAAHQASAHFSRVVYDLDGDW